VYTFAAFLAQPRGGELLREKWAINPAFNVGILTGRASELVAVDIDGPEGRALLLSILKGVIPPTWKFRTGGGGWRLLYRWPRQWPCKGRSFNTEGKPLTIKADGGMTLMPPSRHSSGGQYVWTEGYAPRERPLALTPGGLMELLAPFGPYPEDRKPPPSLSHGAGSGPGELLARARAWVSSFKPAVSGQNGHTQAFTLACALVHGWHLDKETAFALMRDLWNPRCEPPWPDAELRRKIDQAAQEGSYPDLRSGRSR
jgi:hypothetical protein